ncbi:MAG: tetratricopeptide repeat protein [Planctomycetota bacterium]|jgi:tetratricopeptide (TPR) repeat protein
MAVEDLYSKACQAVERANYDYAVRLFRDVLRHEPDHPDARVALRGTERRRREEEGRSLLAMVVKPLHMALTALKGKIAKPRKRLEVCEDYLESYPNSFWGLRHAAAAAAKAGLRAEAVRIYKDALRLRPEHRKALRALGNVLMEEGEVQEGLKYLTRLLNLEPRNRDLQREVRDLTATEHMSAHEMEGATSFRDLIRDKEEAERLEAAGRMTMTVEDMRRQAEGAARDLEEHPDSVNRILNVARLYQEGGQLTKAQDLLREKLQAMPDNYEIREHLGDLQMLVYEEALRALAQKIQQNPDDAEAKDRAEKLKARKQDFAVKEYTRRLKQHPTDRHVQLLLGRVEFAAGNYNEAIAAFQTASTDARYEVETSKMLGLCFMQKGQHDLALEQFEHAVHRHPDMDEVGKDLRYCQGQAYESMGESEEALKIYKRIYSQDIKFKDVAEKVEALSA